MRLELKGIKVRINQKNILKNISLTVEEGEFVSLLGPSGCGKSTLLKTVAGLLEPEEGIVFLGGKQVDGLPPEKRGAVIVFQDLRLFPNMTAVENVEFGLKVRGFPKKEARERAFRMLQSVQLEGLENRRLHQLSGGQLQRVALARAIVVEPHVLLLDEPFSSLDEALRIEMRSLVKELHSQYRCTTILVTHDKKEALGLSDRIALMMDGEILQYDVPEAIYYAPAHKKVMDYFGECVYIKGRVERKRLFLENVGKEVFSPERHSYDVEDGEYLAAIRASMVEAWEDKEGSFLVKKKEFQGEKYRLELEDGHGTRLLAETSKEAVGQRFSAAIKGERLMLFQEAQNPRE